MPTSRARSACRPQLAALLHGQTLYTNLEVLPALMLERGPDPGEPRVRSLGSGREHGERSAPHADQDRPGPPCPGAPGAAPGTWPRSSATEGKKGNFVIGYTREQGHPVCIDLDKFVQRSSGIFGATGTGKSFLTRIILAGLIQSNVASVLIFDMHNEYGPDDTASDTNATHPRAEEQVPGQGAPGGAGARAAISAGSRPISTWRSPRATSSRRTSRC